MSTICVTCLSSDRHLIQLQNLLEYTNIWHGVSLQITDYICWECKAMFNNIWRFKQQVLTAQDVLRNQNLTEIPKVNQCLSKLTKSIKTSYDSEYYEDDVIKTEPPSVDYLDETVLHEEVHLTDDFVKTEDTEFSNEFKVKNEIISNSQEDIMENTQLEVDSDMQTFNFKLSSQEKLFIINVMSENELLKARESDRELPKYKDSPYKCEKCIVAYFHKDQYKNHLNDSHSTELGNFFCKICEVRFSDRMLCKVHAARHYMSYQCKLCEFRSHNLASMLVHHSNEHKVWRNQCALCDAEFITKKLLKRHQNKEHKRKPECTICGKQYSNRNSLKLHMLSHKGRSLVTCNICKKQYMNLKVHMLTHRAPAPNTDAFCSECDKQFKSVAHYKQHMNSNSKHADPNKFSFICAECGKGFSQKSHLSYHLNAIHYNKKDYVCQICDKAFIRPDRLKEHILYTHEGASRPRKFICSYCDKRFTLHKVLINHIRTHTGEKPYECHLCDAKFAQDTALRTHVKGVHKKLFRKSNN